MLGYQTYQIINYILYKAKGYRLGWDKIQKKKHFGLRVCHPKFVHIKNKKQIHTKTGPIERSMGSR